MIESVEKVNWRSEFQCSGWYEKLRRKERCGDFLCISSLQENGVSKEVDRAFKVLEKTANRSVNHTANLLAYLNSKANKPGMLHMPYGGTEVYWLRINGHLLHFKVEDEYEGGGEIRQGVTFVYLDRNVEDGFWMELTAELSDAANGLRPGMHDEFAEEWAQWCA